MNEIEDLIGNSINTLEKSQNKQLDIKTIIWNLYTNIQDSFDCSFTHFRVMDILLKNKFTHAIKIQEHPNYKTNKTFFDGLKNEDFCFIPQNTHEEYDEDTNPISSYYSQKENLIFFDYGSPLWKELLQNESPNPTTLHVFEVILIIMQEAEKLTNTNLIYDWYALSTFCYSTFSNSIPFDILKDKYFKEMKEIFVRSGANKIIPENDATFIIPSLNELNEAPEYIDEDELKVMFWFIKNI